MRVAFIGGTGNLSSECSEAALRRGHDVTIISRGRRPLPDGARPIIADISRPESIRSAISGNRFDAVIDFLCFKEAEAMAMASLFEGITGQFVFISSAAAYEKPPTRAIIDETTPLSNPFWPYARDKIDCERVFMDAFKRSGFPVTIARPSHTYGPTWIPSAFVSSDFTVAARMLAGKEIIVPGDGSSRWTITHARDFAVGLVGLLGRPEAIGEAYTIAGDEAPSWDGIHLTVAAALGVEPRIVHIPPEFIAGVDYAMGERLLGDKAWDTVFDCGKIKRLVPEFRSTITLAAGVEESVAWRRADGARMAVDGTMDARIEAILAAYHRSV